MSLDDLARSADPEDWEIDFAVCSAVLNFWPVKALFAALKREFPNSDSDALQRAAAEKLRELAKLGVAEFFITENGLARDLTIEEAIAQLGLDECWQPNGTYLAAGKKKGTNYFERVFELKGLGSI